MVLSLLYLILVGLGLGHGCIVRRIVRLVLGFCRAFRSLVSGVLVLTGERRGLGSFQL